MPATALSADIAGLIERLSKADAPCRCLDESIVHALCPGAIIQTYVQGDEEKTVFHAEPLVANKDYVPRYTASIDAALTLVPEGVEWRLGSASHRKGFVVTFWLPGDGGLVRIHVDAPTPALTLCIAALRARSAS